MNIKKLNEELEQIIKDDGEGLINELTEQGFKDFFFIEDNDAANELECSSIKELEDTLDDYCVECYYEIYSPNDWEQYEIYSPNKGEQTNDYLMNIGYWKGIVEYEDMSLYGGEPSYYMTRDDRIGKIVLRLDASNEKETVSQYLQANEKLGVTGE